MRLLFLALVACGGSTSTTSQAPSPVAPEVDEAGVERVAFFRERLYQADAPLIRAAPMADGLFVTDGQQKILVYPSGEPGDAVSEPGARPPGELWSQGGVKWTLTQNAEHDILQRNGATFYEAPLGTLSLEDAAVGDTSAFLRVGGEVLWIQGKGNAALVSVGSARPVRVDGEGAGVSLWLWDDAGVYLAMPAARLRPVEPFEAISVVDGNVPVGCDGHPWGVRIGERLVAHGPNGAVDMPLVGQVKFGPRLEYIAEDDGYVSVAERNGNHVSVGSWSFEGTKPGSIPPLERCAPPPEFPAEPALVARLNGEDTSGTEYWDEIQRRGEDVGVVTRPSAGDPPRRVPFPDGEFRSEGVEVVLYRGGDEIYRWPSGGQWMVGDQIYLDGKNNVFFTPHKGGALYRLAPDNTITQVTGDLKARYPVGVLFGYKDGFAFLTGDRGQTQAMWYARPAYPIEADAKPVKDATWYQLNELGAVYECNGASVIVELKDGVLRWPGHEELRVFTSGPAPLAVKAGRFYYGKMDDGKTVRHVLTARERDDDRRVRLELHGLDDGVFTTDPKGMDTVQACPGDALPALPPRDDVEAQEL